MAVPSALTPQSEQGWVEARALRVASLSWSATFRVVTASPCGTSVSGSLLHESGANCQREGASEASESMQSWRYWWWQEQI